MCSAIRKGGHGLFCRNYLLARGNYPRVGVSGVVSVTGSPKMTTYPGWTTCKAGQTWKLMQHIRKVAINVAGMGITLWGYRLSVIFAILET